MDYGKAYTSGNSFRARAEAAQRQFRVESLNEGWSEWGHLLDERAIGSGANFLTDSAMEAATERESKGKGVDHKRTWGNMLSSQAMCFNIFGTLAASAEGRVALSKSLESLGYPVRSVESVEIEFTPTPDAFGDQSDRGGVDCDVLVRFTSPDDHAGVLVMETKFVEPEFSKCGFRSKPEFRLNKKTNEQEKTNRCPEGTVAGCDGSGCRYQTKGYRYWQRSIENQTLADGVCDEECPFGDYKWQLWTNHTLAHILKPDDDAIVLYAVCAPKNNKALLDSGTVRFGKLAGFSSLLRNPDSFSLLSVEDLIASLQATVPMDFPQRQQWLLGLNDRYVVARDVDEAVTVVPVASEVLVAEDAQDDEVFISVALLPAATAIDEASLSEISDSTVIARISQAFPAIAEAAARTAASNALESMEVYRAILPVGESLAKSKAMEGAFRGFGRAGADFSSKFSSHANFVEVDPSLAVAFSTGLANVMNVGSLVVGQYYMSQVNGRLEALNESVNSLIDFNEAVFKSRILSLISHVGEISQFSSEILDDDGLRSRKQQTLDSLRLVATDLLGQANEMIDTTTGKSRKPNPNLTDYTDRIGKVAVLWGYQKALLATLGEISELTYLLGKGSVPSDMSHLQLRRYLQQCAQTNTRLGEWHDCQVKRLHIDLDRERKFEVGLSIAVMVASAVTVLAHRTPVMHAEDMYTRLKPGVAREIRNQTSPVFESRGDLKGVYDEDVAIIIKDGKLFYLPESPVDSPLHPSQPTSSEEGTTPVTSMDLARLLRSVGQKTFVEYFHLFADSTLSNQEVVEQLPQRFTLKARRSKTSHARMMFREGLEMQALEVIAASTRAGNEGTAKAAQDLLDEMQDGSR